MANLVNFGLSNVHTGTVDYADGAYKFGTPEAISGAVNLSIDAEFNSTDVYADNGIYYSAKTNNGYTGTLEMVDLPIEWCEKYLGLKKATTGGYVEVANAQFQDFYLMFQVEGNENPTKYMLYRCTVSTKPSYEFKTTEDSVEVTTASIEFKAMPLLDDSKAIKRNVYSGDSDYATFFTKAPTTPTFASTVSATK